VPSEVWTADLLPMDHYWVEMIPEALVYKVYMLSLCDL
jgi:hypothetical protein